MDELRFIPINTEDSDPGVFVQGTHVPARLVEESGVWIREAGSAILTQDQYQIAPFHHTLWLIADEGDMTSAELPYIITSGSVPTTYKAQYVLSGKAEIVEETDWGVWHVQKITSDYSESETFAWMDKANYILLFDAERGYLLTVKGTSDMETLEHIARELEVRESDTPNPPSK